ncbi:hypothetical protein EDI_252750 [Entamoeba dispar SAW760]|uniref:EF-hand domain-containing protein n=1 Tax=Entamoeba dispar (strain ATCC PRA-260 / SAW760) TaxID=370354 RepID=B0EF80_ENTDS|nr:uncharacterized protein EDI_252750 [Entamoeba dispar SAW760]EDR26810.1 hypothetical protein EDI_252750 [Entamoeba dispar SAW760]|eukprot:EDR26810.1 hypothetical protein EDI_252750 [Entamoeba dispar SAW760]
MSVLKSSFGTRFAFYSLDTNRTGKISFDVLNKYIYNLLSIEEDADKELCIFLCMLCDVDNDGLLSYEEFLHLFYCYSIHTQKGFFKIQVDIIIAVFIKLSRGTDRKCQGYVERDDLVYALRKLKSYDFKVLNQYDTIFQKLINYCDSKGKGTTLSEYEFITYVVKPEYMNLHYASHYETLFNKWIKGKKDFMTKQEFSNYLKFRFTDGIGVKKSDEIIFTLIAVDDKFTKTDVNMFGRLVSLLNDLCGKSHCLDKNQCYELFFRLVDEDNSGSIEGEELAVMVNALKLGLVKNIELLKEVAEGTSLTKEQFVKYLTK